jgi:hypothetical protein
MKVKPKNPQVIVGGTWLKSKRGFPGAASKKSFPRCAKRAENRRISLHIDERQPADV